ncbi:hypothetical protein B0H16DRAFT_1781986 [Mycena metata]|uniref:Uncharacterized protein n=1 Tax=Mycena metata TaxID=1033252 RepID=A0AAD7HPR1_9AGAR|nr:hypothetical protein B0H16DRAFT_1781986 [Mycena metata]
MGNGKTVGAKTAKKRDVEGESWRENGGGRRVGEGRGSETVTKRAKASKGSVFPPPPLQINLLSLVNFRLEGNPNDLLSVRWEHRITVKGGWGDHDLSSIRTRNPINSAISLIPKYAGLISPTYKLGWVGSLTLSGLKDFFAAHRGPLFEPRAGRGSSTVLRELVALLDDGATRIFGLKNPYYPLITAQTFRPSGYDSHSGVLTKPINTKHEINNIAISSTLLHCTGYDYVRGGKGGTEKGYGKRWGDGPLTNSDRLLQGTADGGNTTRWKEEGYIESTRRDTGEGKRERKSPYSIGKEEDPEEEVTRKLSS